MSLTQDRADHVFECDGKGCHRTVETGTSNFEAAQNVMRRNRWKPRLIRGEWFHFCPECQGTLI
jgi:hypothetical protein